MSFISRVFGRVLRRTRIDERRSVDPVSQGGDQPTNRTGKKGHPRFGDVIEIATDKGLAYAQYTHEEPRFYGSLIRVLPGVFLGPAFRSRVFGEGTGALLDLRPAEGCRQG